MWRFASIPVQRIVFVSTLPLAACAEVPTTVDDRAAPEAAWLARHATEDLTQRLVSVGRDIYFDRNLSLHRNQSCASCHDPDWGFTGPSSEINAGGSVYPGSVRTRTGERRPPSAAYAAGSPVLRVDGRSWVGGSFWDGRATGSRLGSPAAEQAQRPFLNPVEQALPDAACVVYRIAHARYARRFVEVWGDEILEIDFPPETDSLCEREGITIPVSTRDRERIDRAFEQVALSIVAFENSQQVSAFSSKYDAYLSGRVKLTPQEQHGLELFEGRAFCARCHVSSGDRPLFTNFSYANLGVPKNPVNPIYRSDPGHVDAGLGGVLDDPRAWGLVKTPTVRNVDRRPHRSAIKAYMHNGAFKSLEEVVHFYNTRDQLESCDAVATPTVGVNCWPAPEVEQNLVRGIVGRLGLSSEEEQAVVAFLRALTDGFSQR